MTQLVFEKTLARLYKRGDKLIDKLSTITEEHAKKRQEQDTIDECDCVMSAAEHAIKSRLYGINAKLFKVCAKLGITPDLYDFEYNDYSGVLA